MLSVLILKRICQSQQQREKKIAQNNRGEKRIVKMLRKEDFREGKEAKAISRSADVRISDSRKVFNKLTKPLFTLMNTSEEVP